MTKWILRGGLAAAALALLLALGAAGWLTERFIATKPQLRGEVEAAGLPAGAQIVRDAHGVAHIFGETDADVYFAVGYAHAAERYFQMDMARRYVQGRLAEVLGADYVRTDARSRIRGYPQAAEAVLSNLSDETRAAVDAYVAGVNARLEHGAPAPEYAVLRMPIETWRPIDSAAINIFLAHDLAAGGADDWDHAALADALSPDQLEQFLDPFPDWAPTTLKDADVRATLDGVEVLPLEAIGETLRERDADGEAQAQPENRPGSNAWVVSGDRTESGAPMLANDPHLGLAAPSIWYFVRLNLSYGPVIGGTIPGTPSVVLGRNAHGAWGFTNTGFDVIDYVERDPGAVDVTERRETIQVRGGGDVELVVRETPEGPVLDEQWFDLSPFDPDKLVVWRSTSTHPDNGVADATLAIMASTGWDSFVDAVRGWTAPMQNMHYAGVDGTIGYTTAGLLPVRDAAGDWTGFVPFDELPRVENPRGGYIASGNNLVAGDVYPWPLPGSYAVYRAPRIEAMLEATERHDAESFAAMQADVTSLLAERILPALLAAEPESELGAAAIARLEGWDAALDPDEPEGLIVSAWLRALSTAIWSDELGALAGRFNQPRRAFLEEVLTGDASAWCDDVRTAAVERCATIAGLALDAAMARTAAQYDDDIDAWRWGEAHQAMFDHAFTGQPILGGLFTVREPVGGDGSTVNVGHFSYAAADYDVFHGPSMRAIYDLSDLNKSLFMHAPGQSGHPLSPHYDDLAPLWAAGEYFQIRDDWTPENPPEGARTLRLVPAGVGE